MNVTRYHKVLNMIYQYFQKIMYQSFSKTNEMLKTLFLQYKKDIENKLNVQWHQDLYKIKETLNKKYMSTLEDCNSLHCKTLVNKSLNENWIDQKTIFDSMSIDALVNDDVCFKNDVFDSLSNEIAINDYKCSSLSDSACFMTNAQHTTLTDCFDDCQHHDSNQCIIDDFHWKHCGNEYFEDQEGFNPILPKNQADFTMEDPLIASNTNCVHDILYTNTCISDNDFTAQSIHDIYKVETPIPYMKNAAIHDIFCNFNRYVLNLLRNHWIASFLNEHTLLRNEIDFLPFEKTWSTFKANESYNTLQFNQHYLPHENQSTPTHNHPNYKKISSSYKSLMRSNDNHEKKNKTCMSRNQKHATKYSTCTQTQNTQQPIPSDTRNNRLHSSFVHPINHGPLNQDIFLPSDTTPTTEMLDNTPLVIEDHVKKSKHKALHKLSSSTHFSFVNISKLFPLEKDFCLKIDREKSLLHVRRSILARKREVSIQTSKIFPSYLDQMQRDTHDLKKCLYPHMDQHKNNTDRVEKKQRISLNNNDNLISNYELMLKKKSFDNHYNVATDVPISYFDTRPPCTHQIHTISNHQAHSHSSINTKNVNPCDIVDSHTSTSQNQCSGATNFSDHVDTDVYCLTPSDSHSTTQSPSSKSPKTPSDDRTTILNSSHNNESYLNTQANSTNTTVNSQNLNTNVYDNMGRLQQGIKRCRPDEDDVLSMMMAKRTKTAERISHSSNDTFDVRNIFKTQSMVNHDANFEFDHDQQSRSSKSLFKTKKKKSELNDRQVAENAHVYSHEHDNSIIFNHKLSDSTQDKPWVIYIDGSCKNNGKKDAIAGSAVVFGINDPKNIMGVPPGRATNIRAEIYALILAFEAIPKTQPVIIYTDCKYNIDLLFRYIPHWIRNGKSYQNDANGDLYTRVFDLYRLRVEKHQTLTQIYYTPAHSNHPLNDHADMLAKRAAETMRVN